MKRFKIVVAVDCDWGIGKNFSIPWNVPIDRKKFADLTKSGKQNALIVGRVTYESMKNINMLNRRFYVVDQCNYKDFASAVTAASAECDEIWICGGRRIYLEALSHPLLAGIYVTFIDGRHECDVAVPEFKAVIDQSVVAADGMYCVNKDEYAYLQCLQRCISSVARDSRAGGKTVGEFGTQLRYKLFNEQGPTIPLMTTKMTPLKLIVGELLWFLRGGTNTDELVAAMNHIWDGNSSREYLDSRSLTEYRPGELGPIYGFQWRSWGKKYTPECKKYTPECVKGTEEKTEGGIDQIAQLIANLKTDPYSRRHIVSAWNVADLCCMALPPCHFSFIVSCINETDLSMMVNMRSNDMFLGHPFNAASYAILAHMIAMSVGRRAVELVFAIADTHVYIDHIDVVKEQISRLPVRFPNIKINKKEDIDSYKVEDFSVENYYPLGKLKAKMAV